MGIFDWVKGGSGSGRGPTEEEKAREDAVTPGAVSRERVPEVRSEEKESVEYEKESVERVFRIMDLDEALLRIHENIQRLNKRRKSAEEDGTRFWSYLDEDELDLLRLVHLKLDDERDDLWDTLSDQEKEFFQDKGKSSRLRSGRDKVLRYLDAMEKYDEAYRREVSLEDWYTELREKKGDSDPETKACAAQIGDAGIDYKAAQLEAAYAREVMSDSELDSAVSATTPEEISELRASRAALAAKIPTGAAPVVAETLVVEPAAGESSFPEIDSRDLEPITSEESPRAKDARWFGGLRDSAGRFVKRHTIGAVDQREELSKSEKLRGGALQLAEGLLGGAASVAGVKIAYDILLGLPQGYFTRAERQALIEEIQKKFQGMEDLDGTRETNPELVTRFSAIESRIDSSEHLGAAQKRELKEKLSKIIGEDSESRRAARAERDDQIRALFEGAIKSRITGAGIAKEAVNTAMVLSGLTAVRGGVMLGFSAAEAYRAANEELKSETEKSGFADVVTKAFTDSWSTYKEEVTGKQGVMGIGRAASKTVRVLGFGAMLGSGFSDMAKGDAHERIDAFLGAWGNATESPEGGAVESEGLGEIISNEEPLPELAAENEAGKTPMESYVGEEGQALERPAAGYEFENEEAVTEGNATEVQPKVLEIGRVREGDGISQTIARQIDSMPEDQFRALAARYGFTGEREFKTGISATGENPLIPKGASLDNERLREYKEFIAKVTREIVQSNKDNGGVGRLIRDGLFQEHVGEISVVLVPDATESSGYSIKSFHKDGTPFEESDYKPQASWNGAKAGAAAVVEKGVASPEVSVGLSDIGKMVKETVYEVDGKRVTFSKDRVFFEGSEVDLRNLADIPNGDTLNRIVQTRAQLLGIIERMEQAATEGDKEAVAKLLTQARGLEQEAGTWGFRIDIPNDAFDRMQKEYGEYVEAPVPRETGVINEISVDRESSSRAVKITFEHGTDGKVLGADLSKFRVIGKDLDIAKQDAQEGLHIDLNDPKVPVRSLMSDVKRYYVLLRLEESLDAGGKGKSAEAGWVRSQLEKLYTKYNPPEV